jgi:methylmalonyl-CoA mutase
MIRNEYATKRLDKVHEKTNSDLKSTFQITREMSEKAFPPHRTRYTEIAGAM